MFNYLSSNPASGQKDQKATANASEPIAIPKMMLSKSRTMAKPGSSVVVKLVGQYVLTSAANSALTQVQALSPISVSDYSSFAAVYDLCRVKGVVVNFRVASSGAINGSCDYAVAFDPSNLGVYAGVSDVMTAQHCRGPFVTGTNLGVAPVNPSGFHSLECILPVQTRITNDGAAAAAVGGGWFGTSDTTAVTGWLKPFIASFGAGVTSTIVYYVTYMCEFKART
jgi:hypothetical protein